jgi:hypothetical protein
MRRGLWWALGGAAALGVMRMLYRQHTALVDLQRTQQQLADQLTDESKQITRQTQALLWLYSQLDLRVPLPPMRGWVISPDFASLLIDLLRQHQPRTVVEFGGGTSTLITAQALKQMGHGHVIAIEAIAAFAQQTAENIQRNNLQNVATVLHAPLTRVDVHGQEWEWYDPAAFADVTDIDFMVVDGPAQHDNPRRLARYPALPMMAERLTKPAVILLDDTKRDDERQIIDRWQHEFTSVQTLATYDEFEKGAVVLSFGQPG